MIKNCKWT